MAPRCTSKMMWSTAVKAPEFGQVMDVNDDFGFTRGQWAIE